jgi:amino acid transporter
MFGVFSAAAVMVGMVVGVGIFTFPSMVAARSPDEWTFLGFWVAGGLVAIIGALCYSELAARHPDAGGEYQFLTRAYGGHVGFLFAWARMTVIQTGSIAVAAYILGDHATELWSLGQYSSATYAVLSVAALTLLHWIGTGPSKYAQSTFTTMIVGALLLAAVAALVLPTGSGVVADVGSASTDTSLGAAGMAMVFVLLTYGGWNETVYLTGEMRDAGRTTLKALALGIGLVTVIYLLINLAYLDVLGFATIRGTTTPGADLVAQLVGATAGDVMTAVVVLAALSTINATIMTGARTNYALGRDFAFMGLLGRWNVSRNAPGYALLVQCAIAVLLIIAGAVSQQSTIETMVQYTAPVFWFFLMLVGCALFVFRWRVDSSDPPTFRVPLYPLLPAIFIIVCAMMMYSSLLSFGLGALLGVAILLSGIPVLLAGTWLGNHKRRTQ